MMELMVVHPHIFWLSLGGLLLAAEMLGGNGACELSKSQKDCRD